MKSFVSGIVQPFTACWQPTLNSCVPGCSMSPEYRFREPKVVSPLVDRLGPQHHDAVATRTKASGNYYPNSPTYDHHPNSAQLSKGTNEAATTEIKEPHSNDVLCGRGGSSNRHLGNMHFRELVAANKKTYVGLTKKQKMLVARKVVEMVHGTEPPGRFLAKDLDTGLWYDIGLPRSLEKTSQALREKNSNEFSRETSETASDSSGAASPRSDSGATSPASIDERSTKNPRSSKIVEAPPLTIPPHLRDIFGPKKPQEAHGHSWPDYASSSRQIEQPYLNSYSPSPSSPTRDPYRVPPRPQNGQRYVSTPPRSPSNRYGNSPGYSQSESPYFGKPSPYGHPEDRREHYDYYTRPTDHHRDHFSSYTSPRMSPRSGRLPPPPPASGHYRRYPPSQSSVVSPYRPPPNFQRPPRPLHHPHGAPSSPVSNQTQSYDHYRYGPTSTTPEPVQPRSSSTPIVIIQSKSNGYVRGKAEVSPERQREWKRQRNETGVVRRLSESSLSNAVKNSLTLEDRVVGQARPSKDLISPSGVLQSRSRRSMQPKLENDIVKSDALSGLAALSTAAFLKLDES